MKENNEQAMENVEPITKNTDEYTPDFTILYEDNHILVVLKPQMTACCPDESKDDNLLDQIKKYIKNLQTTEAVIASLPMKNFMQIIRSPAMTILTLHMMFLMFWGLRNLISLLWFGSPIKKSVKPSLSLTCQRCQIRRQTISIQ